MRNMKTLKAILAILTIGTIALYSTREVIKSTEKKATIAATYRSTSELEPGNQVNKVERRD